MRSHAKASTAGSTQRQAKGLGRFFRGAFAIRGGLPDSKGSSAPAAGRLMLPLSVLVATVVLAIAASPATAKVHLFQEIFGSAAQPSFGNAQGIAIDQSSGDVLVMDSGTISRFNPDGTPDDFSALGTNVIDGQGSGDETPQGGLGFTNPSESQIAVDNSGTTTDGNIYVSQGFVHVISIFSEDGEYLGQLSESSGGHFSEACGVAVDPSGAVYVGDYTGGIHKFIPAANPPVNADYTATFTSVNSSCALAAGAGPSAGFLFVAQFNGPILKLDSSTGEVKYTVAQGSNTTVSVDPGTGDVLAASGSSIEEFDASGIASASHVASFTLATAIQGVAANGASGEVYVSRSGSANLEVFGPLVSLPPVLDDAWTANVARTEATLKARINPGGEPTTYRIEWGPDASYGSSTAEIAIGSDEALHTVTRVLSGLQSGATYHWRVVVTSPVAVIEGPDRTFTTYAPLELDTGCPNQAFRVGPSASLPDCRAYEMVSPVDKNGGEIDRAFAINAPAPAFFQATPSGEKLAYSSPSSFGDQVSTQNVNQYIATRGAPGWSSHGINPPLTRNTVPFLPVSPYALRRAYMAFSEDLSSGWLYNDNSVPITPDGIEGFANIYRRDNENDSFEALTVNPPLPLIYSEDTGEQGRTVGLEFKGASADSSLSAFISTAVLTPDAHVDQLQQKSQVYATSGGQVHLVSVLPDGSANTVPSAVGTRNDRGVAAPGYSDTVDRAVSEDGSRIFWTSSTEFLGDGKIYVRKNPIQPQSAISGGGCTEPTKACTIAVSESIGPGKSRFWTASTDGTKALFTTNIVGNGNSGNPISGDLYEFDVDSETPSLIAGKVTGVVGASESLSHIYFTSKEALDAGAAAGKPNLYLDHEGTIELIATLSASDTGEVTALGEPVPNPAAPRPVGRYSRVTPDGRHLAFMSSESLTGYDNTDAIGANPKSPTSDNVVSINGDADFEVFLFDADAGELTCASCNPSGARPVGRPLVKPFSTADTDADFGIDIPDAPLRQFWTAAWIPTWENELSPSRVLSEDGSRLFFNSFDALVPEDTNGAQDVYQWEEQGTGGCEKEEGCISLISTGQSPQKSEFIEASPDGENVFIRTTSSIDSRDPGLYDLYDARVGGGYPTPTPPPPCLGDACQSVPAAPNDPTPASAGFKSSAGNPPAPKRRRCANKRRRAGKVNSKRKHAKKRCTRSKRRANR